MPAQRVPVPATHRAIWPNSRQVAPLTSDTPLHVTAWLRPRTANVLDVDAVRTAGATPPLRRHYVERKALARATDADPADRELLYRYCSTFGLDVVATHWRSVTIRGPVDRLIEAFGATVAVFEDAQGRRFRHRTDALYLPSDLAGIVRGVFGLHQWPRSRKLGALERHTTPLTARDVAARYAFPAAGGRGETIGILQCRGIFKPNDFLQAMRAQGVSPALPVVKRIDEAAVEHEIATTKDLEASLDVQVAAALAPGARIVVYEAPDDERGFLDAVRDAIFDEEQLPGIVSISYGWPEHVWTPAALDVLDDLFVAAASAGVSVFCSSGDGGAELDTAGKPHVIAPASLPFAAACGGTVVDDDGTESAWQQTGGGFSARFDVQPWQTAARAVAARYAVVPGRGVPDVAAQQKPGYYVVMDGTELAMGGTSAVAPVWAALTARINERLGTRSGFFLPLLYARPGLLGDVRSGGNGYFEAAPGWNPCTGLGIPNGDAIEEALRASAAS